MHTKLESTSAQLADLKQAHDATHDALENERALGLSFSYAAQTWRQLVICYGEDEARAIVETAHLYGKRVAVHAHGADGIGTGTRGWFWPASIELLTRTVLHTGEAVVVSTVRHRIEMRTRRDAGRRRIDTGQQELNVSKRVVQYLQAMPPRKGACAVCGHLFVSEK